MGRWPCGWPKEFAVNKKETKKSPSVLVTGGTGFLGKRLVGALSERGYQVRIIVRDTLKADHLKKFNIEICSGDIRDEAALKKAVQGMDFIVHAAAAQAGEWEIFKQTTIDGTERIFRLARENGVKRIIYISSMSVYQMDGIKPGTALTENSALEGKPIERGYYTASKLAAEKIARSFLKNDPSGISTVILRPATIYGPGSSVFTPMIGLSFFKRLFIVLGYREMKLPFVYVDNLVDAILLSIEHESAIGEILNVIDDDKISKETYLNEYVKKRFNGSMVLFLPFWMVSKLVFFQEIIFKILKKKPVLTRYRLNSASNNLEFSNNKITKKLGWIPTVSIQDGLRKTFNGFRSNQ